MNITFDQSSKKITYSIIIIALYMIIQLLLTNAILSFILILNILYFSREFFYKQLFLPNDAEIRSLTKGPIQDNSLKEETLTSSSKQKTKELHERPPIKHKFPIVSESEMIPQNILQIMAKHRPKVILNEFNDKSEVKESQIEEENNENDEKLLKAFSKAEKLIDKKILEMQLKIKVKKADIMKVQKEIKEELAKTLPEVPKNLKEEEDWDSWSPLNLHQKLLHLEIFCEKCAESVKVQNTQYELTKEQDHYNITTTHEKEQEIHTIVVKVTLDTFEILSRPILQEKSLHSNDQSTKEVEA